jgi:hypothetical protein
MPEPGANPDEKAEEKPEVVENEDDQRAAAAAVNRQRALEQWEANKKKWREMGVPAPLPAKK